MIRIFLFGIPVTFIFCVRTCGKFWLTSGKIGDHTQLNALGLVPFCVCLIMYCFDLQCFLWLLTDSISLSLRCIAIVWTPQLFMMWDRFWALPRCTNMPWTRIRSPRWRNRVAFGGQHRCWEVPRIRLRTLQVIGSQSRYLSLTHSTCKNWSCCGVGTARIFIVLLKFVNLPSSFMRNVSIIKLQRSNDSICYGWFDLDRQGELRCPGLWPHKKWNSKHI